MTFNPVEYGSARSLAEFYWVKITYVYALASKHQWRRIRVDGELRYHVEDAEEALRPGRTRRLRAVLDRDQRG
ncbi:MAG TPA: hypothetical protein VF174_08930 [Micromonosporaceae bacterium]